MVKKTFIVLFVISQTLVFALTSNQKLFEMFSDKDPSFYLEYTVPQKHIYVLRRFDLNNETKESRPVGEYTSKPFPSIKFFSSRALEGKPVVEFKEDGIYINQEKKVGVSENGFTGKPIPYEYNFLNDRDMILGIPYYYASSEHQLTTMVIDKEYDKIFETTFTIAGVDVKLYFDKKYLNGFPKLLSGDEYIDKKYAYMKVREGIKKFKELVVDKGDFKEYQKLILSCDPGASTHIKKKYHYFRTRKDLVTKEEQNYVKDILELDNVFVSLYEHSIHNTKPATEFDEPHEQFNFFNLTKNNKIEKFKYYYYPEKKCGYLGYVIETKIN